MQKSKLQFKIQKSAVVLLAVFLGLAPLAVGASTLSLSPATVSVTQGQSITMTVALNPQGQDAYTVKTELRYPANLLEVKSFNFSDGWLPLTQSGYDLNGVLVKTAGYPGGVSSPITFGTVTFLAKASGTGNVSLTSVSAVYDSGSQNTLTGVPLQASVTVNNAATPTPTPDSNSTFPTPTPTPSETDEQEDEVEDSETEITSNESDDSNQASLTANLGNIISLGTGSSFIGSLVAMVVLYGVFHIVRKRKRKNS